MVEHNPGKLTLSNKYFIQEIRIPEDDYVNQFCLPDESELSTLAKAVYQNAPEELPEGWFLLTTAYNEEDGYFGMACYNSSKRQLAIAHRGSKSKDSFLADIEGIVRNEYTSQISSAVTFAALIIEELKLYETKCCLSITGHSLGGWLAQVTAFTVKYLSVEGKGFKRICKTDKSYHAHTVVFDSPGCSEMLTNISDDYYRRYENSDQLIKSLDVTNYLSSVNLVNTCNRHIGTLFKISPQFKNYSWIELIKDPKSAIEYVIGLKYTTESHTIDQFVNFFSKKLEDCHIEKILDWPLVTWSKSLNKDCQSSVPTASLKILVKLPNLVWDKVFSSNSTEYKTFFNFANEGNVFEPNQLNEDNAQILLHYKTLPAEISQKNINIFSEKERTFLEIFNYFKSENIPSEKLNTILKVNDYTRFLDNFDIDDETVICTSGNSLKEIINRTKRLFLFQDGVHEIMKEERGNCPKIFEARYHSKSTDYKLLLEKIFRAEMNFKDTLQIQEFLEKENENIMFLITSENTKLEALRLNSIARNSRLIEYAQEKHCTFLNWAQLVELNNFVNVAEILKKENTKVDNLLVVECDEINDDTMKLIKKLSSVIHQVQTRKKIVFIISKEFEELLLNINDRKIVKKESNFSFKDLSEDCQQLILQEKLFQLGSQKLSLTQLLNVKELNNLSDELVKKSEYLLNSHLLKILKKESYFINIMDSQLFKLHSLDVSTINIYRDVNCNALTEFLKQDIFVNGKGLKFFISGFREESKDQEFVKYFNAEEYFEKVKELIRNETIMLRKKEKINSEEFKKLCCEFQNKIIYWLQLNYDGNKTVKTIKAFDYDLYIKRMFHYERIMKKEDVVQEAKRGHSYFIFYNMKDLNAFKKDFDLEDDKIKFEMSKSDAIAAFNDLSKSAKSVHLLEVTEDENIIRWTKTSGKLSGIYHLVELSDKSILNEENFIKSEDQIRIISDVPGMGKSTTLSKFSELIESALIIRINLRQITYSDIPEECTYDEIVDFLLHYNVTKSDNEMLKKVLRVSLSQKGALPISIFFDAFDEIKEVCDVTPENIQDKLIKVFKFLMDQTTAKIVITTRKYISKVLEDNLSTFVVEFKDITRDDQVAYLKKFWSVQTLLESRISIQENEKKLELYIGKILEKITNTLGSKMTEWMGIPLLMKMIADIFIPDVTILEKVMEGTNDLNIGINNCCHLYDKFVKKKFDIYFREKICNEGLPPDMEQREMDHFQKFHERLAFEAIGFIAGPRSKLDDDFINKSKGNLNRIGIVQVMDNGDIQFNHRTYAEYFVAYNLMEWLKNKKAALKIDRNYFHLLLDSQYKMIRRFLNDFLINEKALENISNGFQLSFPPLSEFFVRFLSGFIGSCNVSCLSCHDESDTIFHVLIKEKCEALFQFLFIVMIKQNHSKYFTEHKNRDGYTLLHVAAISGQINLLNFLIKNGVYVDQKTDCNKTALLLASEMGQKVIVQRLIEARANVNENDRLGRTALHLVVGKDDKDYASFRPRRRMPNLNEDYRNGEGLKHAANKNREDIVQMLIKAGSDVNKKSNRCENALHWCFHEHTDDNVGIIESLIQANINVDEKNQEGRTPLHLAAKSAFLTCGCSRKAAQLLIQAGANVNEKDFKGRTPLHEAVKKDHKFGDFVGILIKAEAHLNEKNLKGETPLHVAAIRGHKLIVDLLIEAKANVNEKNNRGETPLHWAARKNYEDIVRKLVESKANLNEEDRNGKTPLHWAAGASCTDSSQILNMSHEKTVKCLTEAGASVNRKDIYGRIPLHSAAFQDNTNILRNLIDGGWNINAKDKKGRLALHYAAINGCIGVVNDLIRAGINVDEKDNDGKTPLQWAVEKCRKDVVEALIFIGVNVKKTDENCECQHFHQYYIGEIKTRNHEKIVQVLVEAGANVCEINISNETPLHFAAQYGDSKMIQSLIDNGANVNDANLQSRTPLHLAVRRYQKDIALTLIDLKADVNLKDNFGETPLFWSAFLGDTETVERLIEAGANVNEKFGNGDTPLHWAVVKEQEILIQQFREYGRSRGLRETVHDITIDWPGFQDYEDALLGFVQKYWALFNNFPERLNDKKSFLTGIAKSDYVKYQIHIVKKLIKARADINQKNEKGETPLLWAAGKGYVEVAELLLRSGAEVNAADRDGDTALHWAIGKELPDVEQFLYNAKEVAKGESIPLIWAALDDYEDTFLHLAGEIKIKNQERIIEVLEERKRMVQCLINAGANVKQANRKGETPLLLSTRKSYDVITRELISKSAEQPQTRCAIA